MSHRRTHEARAARGEVWPEHQQILDAICAGEANEAGRLARHHALHAGRTTAIRLGADI